MQLSTPPAYDRTLSLRLDLLIIALDAQPHRLRRTWLRLAKRIAERNVPSFSKAVPR